jgi:hypothetical protein
MNLLHNNISLFSQKPNLLLTISSLLSIDRHGNQKKTKVIYATVIPLVDGSVLTKAKRVSPMRL